MKRQKLSLPLFLENWIDLKVGPTRARARAYPVFPHICGVAAVADADAVVAHYKGNLNQNSYLASKIEYLFFIINLFHKFR